MRNEIVAKKNVNVTLRTGEVLAEWKPLPRKVPREEDLPRVLEIQLGLLKDALSRMKEAEEKLAKFGVNLFGPEIMAMLQIEVLDRPEDATKKFERREGLLRSAFNYLYEAEAVCRKGGDPIDPDELLGEIALEFTDLAEDLEA